MFLSALAMILWPPQLFIPDRTQCFQQPQIFPPWRQWKEAGAKSIVLLWQHIPLPWGSCCLGDIGRAMPVDQIDSEQLPPGKQDSSGSGSRGGSWAGDAGPCTHSRGWARRGGLRCVVLQVLRRGYSQKEFPITTSCVKIRWMAGKPMSAGGVLLKGANAGATVLGSCDQDLQTQHNIRSRCLLLHNPSMNGGELVHWF